jgi:hypothetical protein
MTILACIFIVAWIAASIIGTQAYFRGEQTKPIHERNWNNKKFEQLAYSVTGKETNYRDRTPAMGMDAYTANNLAN